MTEKQDIRWKQRFQNYKKALKRLAMGVEIATERDLSRLEALGLIHVFEFVYEMAWHTISDFYRAQGVARMHGPRSAFRHAFANELIKNGEIWMDMIESKNQAARAYDEEVADKIVTQISGGYFAEFAQLTHALDGQN